MAWTLADLIPSFGSRQPSPQMLGTGMASQAAQNLGSRAYQLYVQEQQAMGIQPLDPQSWMAQNQASLQRTAY